MWRSNPIQSTNRGLAVLFVLGGLCLPARSHAAEPVELEWNGPAGCPSGARVSERIRKLAGPLKATNAPLRAEATVTRRDDGKLHLHLVVRAGDAVGARDIDAKSCDDLAGVAAVALALLLRSPDPLAAKDLSAAPEDVSASGSSENAADSTTKESVPRSSGSAATPNDSSKPSSTSPTPAAQPVTPRQWHLLLRAPTGALGIGPLPSPMVGVMVGAGVEGSSWSILLEGALWRARALQSPDDARFGAEVTRKSASLDACFAIRSGRWAIAPCALMGLEHVSARGTGSYVAPSTSSATWLAPGLGLEARLRIADWLELTATAAGRIETARPTVLIDPTPGYEVVTPNVGRLAPAAAAITLGPQFIW